MKRLLANLALASVLSIFALPLVASLQSPGLPACCRRGGKHHCTENSPETGFKSKTPKCPYASQLTAVPITVVRLRNFELERPSASGFVTVMRACSGYRIAGRQLSDRGPPDLTRQA